jgi:tRNA G18 (ribose-2'-O)-methylase SpoU
LSFFQLSFFGATETFKKAEVLLQIPGTGEVESLNVSTATALLIGEWYRQHHKTQN